ncbi:MBG domain-containing protein, partial [Belliella buryatensis]|uniref:MBG domain-containing protein n=1 Tax=Belliella buryatensis TaxID=1500549 RepID=UPI000B7790BE
MENAAVSNLLDGGSASVGGSASFKGGEIKVAGLDPKDVISISGVINHDEGKIWRNGSQVMRGNGNGTSTVIGFISGGVNGASFTITLIDDQVVKDENDNDITIPAARDVLATDIQNILESLTFFNNDNDPTPSRVLSITVRDGPPGIGAESVPEEFNVHITPVNDPPFLNIPAAASVAEDNDLIFASRIISVGDPDANNLLVTLSITNGKLSLSGTTGLTFTTGDGSDDISMTFSGTITAINDALNGLLYAPTPDFFGTATLTFFISDQGEFGQMDAGVKALTISRDLEITVTPVNDPPVVDLNMQSKTVLENAPASDLVPDATVIDIDSDDFNSGIFLVSGLAEGDILSFPIVENNSVGAIWREGNNLKLGTGSASSTIGSISGGFARNNLRVFFSSDLVTPAVAQAVIRAVTFFNDEDNPVLARTLSLIISDGDGGTSQARNIVVNITPVNDRPVISGGSTFSIVVAGGASTSPPVDGLAAGFPVSEFFAVGRISDPDETLANQMGIAITALKGASNDIRSYHFSINGGLNWTEFPNNTSIGTANAFLLSNNPQTRIYIRLRNSNSTSNTVFDFRAWDRSLSGESNGSLVSLTTLGGTSSASSSLSGEVVTLALNSVETGSPPANVFTNVPTTVDEDNNLKLSGFSFSDPDLPNGSSTAVFTIRFFVDRGIITGTSDNGVTVSGSGTSNVLFSGTFDDLNSYLGNTNSQPIYQPLKDFNGLVSLTVLTTDDTGLTASDVVTITVNPVNDAPVVNLNNLSNGINNTVIFQSLNGEVLIAPNAEITDVEEDDLTYLKLVLSNPLDGTEKEGLALNASATAAANGLTISNTITATGEIILEISGDATLGVYQDILKGVLYFNEVTGNLTPRRILVEAFDGEDESEEAVASINLIFENSPPVLNTPLPDKEISINLPFSFSFPLNSFTDPDADPLTYRAKLSDGNTLPGWLVFDPTNLSFTGIAPSTTDQLDIRITATDPSGASVSDVFRLQVLSTLDGETFVSISFPKVYELVNAAAHSSTGFYQEETNSFTTGSPSLVGSNFVFVQKGTSRFSGNNVVGTLYYLSNDGLVIQIDGVISRPVKSVGNTIEGLYFWVNKGTPEIQDDEAYLLVINESFFSDNTTYKSSSDRVDTAMNTTLDSPAFSIIGGASLESLDGLNQADGSINFTISRSSAVGSAFVTATTLLNALNTASLSDFQAKSELIQFADGESSKTFTVTLINDFVFEQDETFTVELSNPSTGTRIDVRAAAGTILDDDDAAAFSIAPSGAVEGNPITFTVTRVGDAQVEQSVSFVTSIEFSDTASDDDFTFTQGTLTFLPGEKVKTFQVQTTDDDILEDDETFTVSLFNPTGGAILKPGENRATGTIENDEGVVIYSISGGSATEGGSITFTVTRTGKVQNSQQIDFTTIDGTAESPADYEGQMGTLTFATDDLIKTIQIQTLTDNTYEGTEEFTIVLSNLDVSNLTIDELTRISSFESEATGTILDANSKPQVRVLPASAKEGEILNFTITRNTDSKEAFSINYITRIASDDNASLDDFEFTSGQLIFAPTEMSKTVGVQLINDNISEGLETFTFTLSDVEGDAVLVNDSNQEVAKLEVKGTIIDNDGLYVEGAAPIALHLGNDFFSDPDSFKNLTFSFDPALIRDGVNEKLLIINSSEVAFSIDLNSTSATGTFDLGGFTYSYALSAQGGLISIQFSSAGNNLTAAQANALISSLHYENISQDPDGGVIRVFDIEVTGINDDEISVITFYVIVEPVNDAPVLTVPVTTEANPLAVIVGSTLAITGISVEDLDAGLGEMSMDISVDSGSTLAIKTGVSGGVTSIFNNGTASVIINGTLAEINTTLAATDGLVFSALQTGAVTMTLTVDDGGNSGSMVDGVTSLSDTKLIYLKVTGAADASMSTITANPTSITADGLSTATITIQLKDANGNNTSDLGGKTLTLETDAGTLDGTLTTSGSGLYTQVLKSATTVGTATLTAKLADVLIASTATVEFTSEAPSGLAFVAQPSNAVIGESTGTITVEILDANGNRVTNNSSSVTLSIANNAGNGTLSGTVTVNAVSGLATFSGLSLNKVGTGYTLSATSSGLTSATSNAFDVVVGSATQIAINAGDNQSATVGTALATAPSVIVRDANDNPVAGVEVTFAVVSGGGTVDPTTVVTTDANGIASVTSWTLGAMAGTNTLTATSTGLTGSPLTFTATATAGSADRLVITSVSPTSPINGVPRTTVTVQLQDAFGNSTNATADIPILLTSNKTFEQYEDEISNAALVTPSGGTLSSGQSTLTIDFIKFTQSSRTESGTYPADATLTVTDGRNPATLTGFTTEPFVVTDGTLWRARTTGAFPNVLVTNGLSTGNWNAVDWETSIDGGTNWTTVPAGSVPTTFGPEEIIGIPGGGITIVMDSNVSLHNMIVNSTLEIPIGHTLTLKQTAGDLNPDGIEVCGALQNSGGTFVNEDETKPIRFNGGTYIHARDGGSIPVANWVTRPGETPSISAVRVTGIDGSRLDKGLDQAFEQLIWDNVGQMTDQTLHGNMSVSTLLDIKGGKISIGNNTLSIAGTVQHGNDGWLHGSEDSELEITGSGSIQFGEGPSEHILRSLSLNSAGGLTLNSNLSIVNSLTLTAGELTVSGSNELNYSGVNAIDRTNGFVVGNLRRTFPSTVSAPSFTYPIGTAGAYAPVTLDFSAGSIPGGTGILASTKVQDGSGVGNRPAGSGFKSDKQASRYWSLVPDATLSDITYDVTLILPDAELTGLTFNTLSVRKFSESGGSGPGSKKWKAPKGSSRSQSGGLGSLTATGFTDFSEFFIGEGEAASIVLTGPDPATVAAGSVSGDITLTVVDALGEAVAVGQNTAFTLSSADESATAVFGGTTVSESGGVYTLTVPSGSSSATFTYTNSKVGDGIHTLTATWSSGGADLGSDTFDIGVEVGAPSSLAFVAQPSNAVIGESTGTITVEILDANGNRVTNNSSSVTLSIANNAGSETLSGTATVNAVSGLATFSGLSLNKVGTGYTLSATSSGLTSATSNDFDIAAKELTITGLTGDNKVYDGKTTATVSGTASLVGVVSPDDVALSANPVFTFAQATVGTGIEISTNYTLTGDDAGNYTLTQPTLSADITKATATVTLADLNQTFDGTAKPATATTDPADLTVSFTYDGSATAPTNAGSYAVVGTVEDDNYEGSASGTLVIGKATATASLEITNSPVTYDATEQTAVVAVGTSSVPGTVANVVNGAHTNAGTYAVTADFVPDDTDNYETLTGLSAGDFVIGKATATLTLGSLSQTYDGTAKFATVTTDPVDLTVSFTYDGSAMAPTNAGSYAVVAKVVDANYEGSATGTLVIGKATATLTLGSLSQT